MGLDILFFVGCLVLVLGASEFLARGIDRVGSKLHLSDQLVGVLTALGADSPEISSAIVALMSGRRDLGVGIVLGSNLFNLAALLGLGAVISGEVAAQSAGTVFNGGIGVAVTLVAGALISGFLSPPIATILMLLVVIPYIYILAVGPPGVKRLKIPHSWKRFLTAATRESQREEREAGKQEEQAAQRGKRKSPTGEGDGQSWKAAFLILPALAVIVAGSIGLIHYATILGRGWLPEAVLGTFVLASLTGLPNSLTAVRLARNGNGAAVITETFNSNTINLLVGLLVPALVFGEGSPKPLVILDICWLVVMTVTAVVLSARCSKLTRNQGIALIALYVCFIAAWAILFLKL